mmetsp:Transcript_28800/g.51698  ORF Transcript_28800/g.51698 Transcript_28800/m.51698 type:complete len:91 (-) Transcript_28800:417-689(-)
MKPPQEQARACGFPSVADFVDVHLSNACTAPQSIKCFIPSHNPDNGYRHWIHTPAPKECTFSRKAPTATHVVTGPTPLGSMYGTPGGSGV